MLYKSACILLCLFFTGCTNLIVDVSEEITGTRKEFTEKFAFMFAIDPSINYTPTKAPCAISIDFVQIYKEDLWQVFTKDEFISSTYFANKEQGLYNNKQDIRIWSLELSPHENVIPYHFVGLHDSCVGMLLIIDYKNNSLANKCQIDFNRLKGGVLVPLLSDHVGDIMYKNYYIDSQDIGEWDG